MPLKYISCLQLRWLFCSAGQDHFSTFGRGHYEEHLCGNILNFTSGLGGNVV